MLLSSWKLKSGSSPRWIACLVGGVCTLFIFAIATLDPLRSGRLRFSLADTIPHSVSKLFVGEGSQSRPVSGNPHAYAIFLAANLVSPNETDINTDMYFVGARLLVYQLLYAPETRIRRKCDVVVVTTPQVKEEKRERLRKDGATVVTVQEFDKGWVQALLPIWQSVILKLRLWQFTQYRRILLLDSDIVLQTNLDDIFDEPEAELSHPDHPDDHPQLDREAPYPSHYVLAATAELSYGRKHFPPTEPSDYLIDGGYLNAGFMLLKPSEQVFDYYMSLTKVESKRPDGKDLFDKNMPEQALLNYAHRWDGPMPWVQLSPLWCIHDPRPGETSHALKSIHAKFWGKGMDPVVAGYLLPWYHRMLAFWEEREGSILPADHLPSTP